MNIYLVILIIIAIVVLSNAMMFAAVRGFRGTEFNWFNKSKNDLSQPFQNENAELNELRQRVKDLEKKSDQQSE